MTQLQCENPITDGIASEKQPDIFHMGVFDETEIQEYLSAGFREGDLQKLVNAFQFHMECLQAKKDTDPGAVERFLFSYLKNITKESSRVGVSLERFDSYVPAVAYLLQSDEAGCAEAAIHLTEQILKHISVHRTMESNHLLNMAKDYIRAHLGDTTLNLESVSDHVGLSRVYFCKLFHQMEGVSFNTFLKHERIEKAKELLLTTNMKVFEVSNMVGFSHAKYFGHVFKETVGQTPANYQRNAHIELQ